MPSDTDSVQGKAPPTRVRSLLAMPPSDVTAPQIHPGFTLPAFRYAPLHPSATTTAEPDAFPDFPTLIPSMKEIETEAPRVHPTIPPHSPSIDTADQVLPPALDALHSPAPLRPQPIPILDPELPPALPNPTAASGPPQRVAPTDEATPPASPMNIPGVSARKTEFDLAYQPPVTPPDAGSKPPDSIVAETPDVSPQRDKAAPEPRREPVRYAPEVLARASAIQAQLRGDQSDDVSPDLAQPSTASGPPQRVAPVSRSTPLVEERPYQVTPADSSALIDGPQRVAPADGSTPQSSGRARQPSVAPPPVSPTAIQPERRPDLPQIVQEMEQRLDRLERSQREFQRDSQRDSVRVKMSPAPVPPPDTPPQRIVETRSLVRVIARPGNPPGRPAAFWERQSSSLIRSRVLR
jgi:hypothetical protein